MPDTASKFYHFAKLPFEIRSKIWLDSLPDRLITVHPEFSYTSCAWKVQVRGEKIALLQVSREARAECLRGYVKLDCQNTSQQQMSSEQRGSPACKPHFYINFSRDTILLNHTNEMPTFEVATNFLGEQLEKIQVLAVDFEYCAFDLWSYKKLQGLVVNLKELIFVTPAGSTRCLQRTHTILKPLEPNHRHPDFQGWDFRFMFQDLTEPCDSLFENHIMFGTRFTSCLAEGFDFKTRLAEREVIPCEHSGMWEVVSPLKLND